MNKVMYSLDEVAKKINDGEKLILAGDENLLNQLPAGHWIGGTIPYFMAENGGAMMHDKIHVTQLPDYVKKAKLQTYSEQSIGSVFKDAFENGLSFIIIPASSGIHLSFAINAPNYEDFAVRPLIGWVSGVHLDDIGKVSAKVFFGENKKMHDDKAVVLHLELPAGKYAEINILNIFEQGMGDSISFSEDGFNIGDALINGKKRNFADYLTENKIDTRFPLVADYCGAMINVSFQAIDTATNRVTFYAPVFKNTEYRFASPIKDYVKQFTTQMPTEDSMVFSCNCILNYIYSELEGKKTGETTGPITFGEIAYQLLNQTLAYVTIKDV